jgi:hypothetical protein
MLYYWILFFFIAFGSKFILALITIYIVLPAGNECGQCDGETLLMRGGRVGRFTSWLLMHRVQRRWCPLCGWEGLARRVDIHTGPSHAGIRDHVHSIRHIADR